MAKSDLIKMDGVVTDVLPGARFLVQLEKHPQSQKVKATISGRLRQNHIKILKGDRVTVRVSPYDFTNGIITWRYKS